jgi:hypothetical protein
VATPTGITIGFSLRGRLIHCTFGALAVRLVLGDLARFEAAIRAGAVAVERGNPGR